MRQPPAEFIANFGSAVAAKSVKLIEKGLSANTQHVRDRWWLELRTEIASHMRSVGCDAIIGYDEQCCIYEDLCVLSCHGTAIRLGQPPPSLPSCARDRMHSGKGPNVNGTGYERQLSEGATPKAAEELFVRVHSVSSVSATGTTGATAASSNHEAHPSCSACHLPNAPTLLLSSAECVCCRAGAVPTAILASCELPEATVPVVGMPGLVQSVVCRTKREHKGEAAAKEVSEMLPFIEYELHDCLLQKLKLRGFNAVFGLRFQLTIGQSVIAVVAIGTGVYLRALPPPPLPKISSPLSALWLQVSNQMQEFRRHSELLYGFPSTGANGDKENIQPSASSHSASSATSSSSSCSIDQAASNTTRETEPSEMLHMLQDPLPPPAMLIANSQTLPHSLETARWLDRCLRDKLGSDVEDAEPSATPLASEKLEHSWWARQSYVRLMLTRLTQPDSFLEANHHGGETAAASATHPQANGSNGAMISSTISLSSLAEGKLSRMIADFQRHTWNYLQHMQPCALLAASFNVSILDDDDLLQIVHSGFILRPRVKQCPPDRPACAAKAFSVEPVLQDEQPAEEPSMKSISRYQKITTLHAEKLKSLSTGGSKTLSLLRRLSDHTLRWRKHMNIRRSRSPGADAPTEPTSAAGTANGLEGVFFMGAEVGDGENMFNSAESSTEYSFNRPSRLPGEVVERYLGDLDFFFVRETTDLREMGGMRGFLYSALKEAQTVIGAHTLSLGGNALLSYQLSEFQLVRSHAKNQATCLIHVCGDVVRLKDNPSTPLNTRPFLFF